MKCPIFSNESENGKIGHFKEEARDKKETGGHGPWVKMGHNGRSFDEKCKVVMVKNTLVKKLQGLVFLKSYVVQRSSKLRT